MHDSFLWLSYWFEQRVAKMCLTKTAKNCMARKNKTTACVQKCKGRDIHKLMLISTTALFYSIEENWIDCSNSREILQSNDQCVSRSPFCGRSFFNTAKTLQLVWIGQEYCWIKAVEWSNIHFTSICLLAMHDLSSKIPLWTFFVIKWYSIQIKTFIFYNDSYNK